MTHALFLASAAAEIPPLLIAPFALLLLLIAAMPLTPDKVKHWWEHNYPKVSIGLALLVGVFYLLKIPEGGHVLMHTSIEYVSFIALIGSLFVVAGGIHIKAKGEATPLDNVILLLIGAVLANFIGTTGASMVLIRPFIRMNKIRISSYHIVFFIFIVSNCGGSLTPIGDPPLFLGYLRGVPFFWLTEHVVFVWLTVIGLLLVAFYAFDLRGFKRAPKKIQAEINEPDTFRFEGGINVIFLLVIIGAVFLPDVFFLRELVMIGAAVASYYLTPKVVHTENHFSFGPIKEVAFLFVGIFVTMMPALGYLEQHGREFGVTKPIQYYFATGSLSAVLDNAPTYVNFLKLAEVSAAAEHPEAFAAAGGDEIATVRVLLETQAPLVVAVSLGAVFFGAMTYIGNGPNFMVKSIADGMGVKTPSFVTYIVKFSLPILLPILALAGWLFL
ncbi:MAG TPA: sodium:proton antiporter [Rariglobus sp.]|nr:sodium:proton antiporter [Rariglobus sp.]